MKEINFSYTEVPGLGPEPGVMRRDNSDVIRVEDLYHLWYTKGLASEAPYDDYPIQAGYHGRIWHATSPDGVRWNEEQCAVDKGPAGSLEAGGVFTPNIHRADGRYWLGYCAIAEHKNLDDLQSFVVGQFLAVSDDPFGPWKRVGDGPFLWPVADPAQFDSFRVDGLSFLRRNGTNWVYYKGRQKGKSPRETKLGMAVADSPDGPWKRHPENPVIPSGHEVMFWREGTGVATVVNWAGPQAGTVQYSPDGFHFQVIGTVVNPPDAPSHFSPTCWDEDVPGETPRWGISMVKSVDPLPYLVRWEARELNSALKEWVAGASS